MAIEADTPYDAETFNYAAGERPSTARVPRPAATPVPVVIPAPTSSFRDPSLTFEQRMARNQLPAASPSSTPFLDRAKALQERAATGIKSLIGDQPTPTPTAPPNPN